MKNSSWTLALFFISTIGAFFGSDSDSMQFFIASSIYSTGFFILKEMERKQ